MKDKPKKIVIVGVSATGKSTYARKIADVLKLPLTFIDTLAWSPGWIETPDVEVAQKLENISRGGSWIIEGYITKEARTFLFERSDLILYLDYGRFLTTFRYLTRWWKHRKDPRPELPGSPEKFSFKFMKLVYTKGEAISLNRYLKEVPDQSKIVILHSPREAHKFLNSLK